MSRTDIAGTGLAAMRERVADVSVAAGNWWNQLPAGWSDRFYVQPFAAMETLTTDHDNDASTPDVTSTRFAARKLGQRQAVLDDHCSQFIVEFAGDFAPVDGVLDFDTVNGIAQTRWYGLPRDASDDGTIAPSTGDVLPVASYVPRMAFEKHVPGTDSTITGYPNGTDEPSGAQSPASSGYVCVWGPNDAAPLMVRMLVEVADERNETPMVQEHVFSVKAK